MKLSALALSTILLTLQANDFTYVLPKVELVTSKTLQNNIDIPQTIQTISTQKLEIYNVNSINNLSASISNTNISGIGSRFETTISMRGLSNYTTSESSVSVYVDDTPIPFSYGFGAINFRDVEKIEVLKGPQGTLYGRASESAVINIYTPKPTKEFKSQIKASLGTYNTKNIYAFISGPINDELTYMFSVYKDMRDGFSTNTYFNEDADYRDSMGFNSKLLYTPNSLLSIALKFAKDNIDDGGSAFKTNTKKDPYQYSEPYKEYLQMDTNLASVNVKYCEKNYTLMSISSYTSEKIKNRNYVALNGGVLLDREIEIEEFTQEMRLNYAFNEDLNSIFGVFYSNKFRFDYDDTNSLIVLPISQNWNLSLPDISYAVFSQLEYWFTDSLSLTAGLRYEVTEKKFQRNFTSFSGTTDYASIATTWDRLLPKLALAYYIDEDSNVYLSYAEGYRPGGYNYRSTGPDPLPYDEESTKSFELGYKNNINNTLHISGALFYNFINDLRIVTFADDLSTTVKNANKATSYGGEIELTYKPDTKLYLFSSLGFTKGEMKEFSGLDGQFNGNKIIDVPLFTASLGGKYNFYRNYFFQSDLRYVGERFYDIANITKESSYEVFNIGVGFEKDSYKALLYANNVLAKEYVDYMIATPSNNYYHFGNPRVIGFEFSKSF